MNRFLGVALPVVQVDHLTPGGTINAADTFVVKVYSDDGAHFQELDVVAGGTTVAAVTAAVTAAFNTAATSSDPTYSYFWNLTATDSTTYITITGTAGIPFTITVATIDGGGGNTQTFAQATITTGRGPSDWNSPTNWSTGAVPVDGDEVVIDGQAQADLLYGLDQSTVTLARLTVYEGFTFNCGTLKTRLRIKSDFFSFGLQATDGSRPGLGPIFNINLIDHLCLSSVYQTGASGSQGMPSLLFYNKHASARLLVAGASFVGVGIADLSDSPELGYVQNNGTGTVILGAGGTWHTIINSGAGKIVALATCDTKLRCERGSILTEGTFDLPLVECRGGTIKANHRAASGASIDALSLIGGLLDVSGNAADLTITATTKPVGSESRIMALTASQVTHTDSAIHYSDGGNGFVGT